MNDNATVLVRVEDKFVDSGGVTTRCNEIKVFYGDASDYTFENDSRTKDAVATNKAAGPLLSEMAGNGGGGTLPPINPQWPTNQFGLSGSSIANWYNNQTTTITSP